MKFWGYEMATEADLSTENWNSLSQWQINAENLKQIRWDHCHFTPNLPILANVQMLASIEFFNLPTSVIVQRLPSLEISWKSDNHAKH